MMSFNSSGILSRGIHFWQDSNMAGFSFGGIQVRWDSYSAGFIFGEIHFRRDSVLAGFVFSGIHFGGISSGGLWNGGILSYSPKKKYFVIDICVSFNEQWALELWMKNDTVAFVMLLYYSAIKNTAACSWHRYPTKVFWNSCVVASTTIVLW